jgi:phage recombination protein Bet
MSKISQFPAAEAGAQSQAAPDQKALKETALEYLKAYGFDKSLSESEQSQFVQTALASGLNPFKREIHIAVYGEAASRKVSVITGCQIYLKRAERTGNLDGWRAWLEGGGSGMNAVVEIFRKDWSHSFTHEVYFEEAVQKKKDGTPTQFWAKQPRFQLRKVAMAQAFRLAFPDELGSLPYETAELPDSESAPEPLAATPAVKTSNQSPTTQTAAEDDGDDDLPDWAKPEKPAVNSQGEPEGAFSETIGKIQCLFENHPEDFTRKHRDWILNNALKATDRSGVLKMLAYAEKVIRKASA